MSIRDQINKNPLPWLIGLAVVVGAVLLFVFLPGDQSGTSGYRPAAFFSDDDGQSYFIDRPDEVPPYEREGKEVVSAVIARDKTTNEEFVLYLAKYDPAVRSEATAFQDAGAAGPAPPMLIKRPGDEEWVVNQDPSRAAEIQAITTPPASPAGNGYVIINPRS